MSTITLSHWPPSHQNTTSLRELLTAVRDALGVTQVADDFDLVGHVTLTASAPRSELEAVARLFLDGLGVDVLPEPEWQP